MIIADLRKEYTRAGLRRADLAPDAMLQFENWFKQTLAAGLMEPNAMVLSTANRAGEPSSRVVLLKGFDHRGFLFFTNYQSRKGCELAENPAAALTFFWAELERRVCVAGQVSRLSREESEAYFQTRPRGSRLATWVSNQTQVLSGRAELEQGMARVEQQHPGEQVPMPEYWGGFVLRPRRVEFWQGRPNRLHDRFRYTRQADDSWLIERLAP